jgi:hypothetical protein
MPETVAATIMDCFAELSDPRIDRTRRHELSDIITIAICAVIPGADGWVAVEKFREAKRDWLATLLVLPEGIPSHDTFGRVFACLDREAFERCFVNWVRTVSEVTAGQVIAIDGKCLRRSMTSDSLGSDSYGECLGHREPLGPGAAQSRLEVQRDHGDSGTVGAVDGLGVYRDHRRDGLPEGDRPADYRAAGRLRARFEGESLPICTRMWTACSTGPTTWRSKASSTTRVARLTRATDGGKCASVGRSPPPKCIAMLTEAAAWSGLRTVIRDRAERHTDTEVTCETRYYLSSLAADTPHLTPTALAATRRH